jgi:hypothetical protein
MHGAITPLPNTHSWHRAQLKHRDQFTLHCSVCRRLGQSSVASVVSSDMEIYKLIVTSARNVGRKGEMRNGYKILVGRPEMKRPRRRWG